MANILRMPTNSDRPDLFASARAALKHAPTPVEKPINPLVVSKRQGQPTVGVTPDKMAAFLSEMKTVRLRKVSGIPGNSSPTVGSSLASRVASGPGALRRTASVGQSSLRRAVDSSFDPRSFRSETAWHRDNGDNRTSEKRKRDGSGHAKFQDDLRTPFPECDTDEIANIKSLDAAVKRRSIVSSDSSFASSSSSHYLPPSSVASTSSFSWSDPSTSRATLPVRTWPSTSVTDAATPSLCSDNDVEREDDTSPDDHPPSTPPIALLLEPAVAEKHPPEREIIDVDMLSDGDDDDLPLPQPSHNATKAERDLSAIPPVQKRLPVSPRVSRPTGYDLFSKRPPSSPMPAHSPRKPRPPARASRPMPPPWVPDDSDNEDPLSLTFSSPEPEPATLHYSKQKQGQSQSQKEQYIPKPEQVPRQASASPASAQFRASARPAKASTGSRGGAVARRRLTLDEELRDAEESTRNREEEEDLESGVLVGVGTRSKHLGFLAHGGAGGGPVFMGIGYVEGVEENVAEINGGERDDEYEEVYHPPPRSVKSTAVVAKRKGRR